MVVTPGSRSPVRVHRLVAEFCIAEFAVAIGRSTDSGRAMIAHAVETKYRLPRTWSRVVSW